MNVEGIADTHGIMTQANIAIESMPTAKEDHWRGVDKHWSRWIQMYWFPSAQAVSLPLSDALLDTCPKLNA